MLSRKQSLWIATILSACCLCVVGGFAVGAYLQFRNTVMMTQDVLARDILTANMCVNNGCTDVMKWLRVDAPLQLNNYSVFEAVLREPLQTKLYHAARLTWEARDRVAITRPPDVFLKKMRDCNCGLTDAEPNN